MFFPTQKRHRQQTAQVWLLIPLVSETSSSVTFAGTAAATAATRLHEHHKHMQVDHSSSSAQLAPRKHPTTI